MTKKTSRPIKPSGPRKVGTGGRTSPDAGKTYTDSTGTEGTGSKVTSVVKKK